MKAMEKLQNFHNLPGRFPAAGIGGVEQSAQTRMDEGFSVFENQKYRH
ncbi:hypothetical protein [Noviherbaspirillum saxi]|nr:hypothetical protein [Noviherbaspirillum saxi]